MEGEVGEQIDNLRTGEVGGESKEIPVSE